MNIRTYMITENNVKTAENISSTLKIKKEMTSALPEDNLREIENIQKNGIIVAFVGDGINDAPDITKQMLE